MLKIHLGYILDILNLVYAPVNVNSYGEERDRQPFGI